MAAMEHIEQGRARGSSGRRGELVLDEGEERVLLETARLLLEDSEASKVTELAEVSRALERAAALLSGAGGPGLSRAPVEQRRRYHEVLARRLEERLRP